MSEIVDDVSAALEPADHIPVHISYEIIKLFSEGLYQSPHKAIEELVSNGYDAGADSVHVLLPDPSDAGAVGDPLWVIDNGHGLTAAGFHQLWKVAHSDKTDALVTAGPRLPIGQFGIGKLASYVLAWRLTHISKADGRYHYTSMDFRGLQDMHLYEPTKPFTLSLYEIAENRAREILADVGMRSASAWELLFGQNGRDSWTAARLTDFKGLYDKLSAGRLKWVLSTGLPLKSDFTMWVDNEQLRSSKESFDEIDRCIVGGNDSVAEQLGLSSEPLGIRISGIPGLIAGAAVIYQRQLTKGKSDQYGRSHGFFVRVRDRVINLEDELFGLDALNHAAWSRFSMEIHADGLRDHLLSSREGVRESEPVDTLRKYLHGVFNGCRRAYDEWIEDQDKGLEIQSLLRDAPSLYVTEPLLGAVKRALEADQESFYVAAPKLKPEEDPDVWLSEFEAAIRVSPFGEIRFEETGRYGRALRFEPSTRSVVMNTNHPFVDKLLASAKNRSAVTLFGSSEVLLDSLLQESGVAPALIVELLRERDRVLRLIAGDQPSTAEEVLWLLDVANRNPTALERATGAAFRVLGFEYERRGGHDGGPDGVLYARLGRGDQECLDDYKVVYDAKQTNSPSVAADKIDLASLEEFRSAEGAQFGFFIADAYTGQDNPESALNRKLASHPTLAERSPISLLRIRHLRRLIELHYRHGVTLTQLRSLFTTAQSVAEVEQWVSNLERELDELEPQVSLLRLLSGLEAAKSDRRARPNVNAVRALDANLQSFSPERLTAALLAVETIVGRRWIEVDKPSGDIRLHHTAIQVATEVERVMGSLLNRSEPEGTT